MNRVDAFEKVTGKAKYSADHHPEGCLYALALRSPIARGRITAIDATPAASLPGVEAVVTHLNASEFGWIYNPSANALGAEELGRPSLGDQTEIPPSYQPLCGPDIYFAGQWVAVCVGRSIEATRAAIASIKVEYNCEPLRVGRQITPGFFFNSEMQYSRGAAEPGGEFCVAFDATYTTPPQLHQPMEPSATVAVWVDDRVTLYDSNQGTHAARSYVAASLGLPVDKVRIVACYVGGGFGQKNQVWPHQALAAHLARHLRRPVRMQLTRQDMAVACGYRSETTQHMSLTADPKGRLGLLRHVCEVPTSLSGGFFEPCGLSSIMLYKAARVEVEHIVRRHAISTPTVFRAPGEAPGSFALETALDELAHKLRMNPIQLRIANYAERDASHDREWSSNHLLECYAAGASKFGWPDRYVEPRSLTRNGKQVGIGVAVTAYPAPVLPAAVKLILDRQTGLTIKTSATDIGTGMRTVLAQGVCEHLGVDLHQVSVVLGDSDLPDAPTAGRSKSTASILPAVKMACDRLLGQLDELELPGSLGTNRTSVIDRLERSGASRVVAEGASSGVPNDRSLSFYSFGAHFVEVEVDEMIGRLTVTRVVTALDCGTIVNRKLAESQIKGGAIFGVGMALMENARRHPSDLSILTDNLAEYAIPVHADIPAMDVIFLDYPDTALTEAGVRGIGEIGLPGVAAAIGNAVFSATGRRSRSVPVSLELLQGPWEKAIPGEQSIRRINPRAVASSSKPDASAAGMAGIPEE